MKKLFGLFRKRWFLTLLGVVALAVLLWYLGPYFGFAGSYPLEGVRPRWIGIGCLFGIWALAQIWRAIAAWRRNRGMMDQLAEAAPEPPHPDAAETASAEELQVLSGRFDEALAVLRKSDVKHRLGGFYVYQLPWYLIIGPPGCGKTTALVNSGLRFPLAERFGQDPIRGVGGTRNCDWWFSDEAVLLDTAGRYTTQDSYEAVDSAAWQGFLGLLKKSRPRRPVNGVLVAVSLADLMQQSETERAIQARAIKQRVQELHQHLGIRFPMYVFFMKCDLVAGFMEVFGDLSKEERAQVWGMTFHMDEHTGASQGIEGFSREMDLLEGRINEQLLGRLQHERDPQKRALIFAFPQQFAALKETTDRFLRDVFQPSRYEENPLVRGVYFTSGTQTGAPIDRVMSEMAANLGLGRKALSAFTGSGRSFFINRLFRDLIFREAGLAGTDLRLERHRRWIQRGAYSLAIGITLIAALVWSTSYLRNRAYIDEVAAQTADIQAQVDELQPQEREPLRFLPLLNAMRDIPGGYGDNTAPLMAGFGLSQRDKLGEAARDTYKRTLEKTLFSAVILRLEEQIRSLMSEPEKLHEALRVYLMLYDDAHYDPQTVRAWANAYWQHNWPREIPVEQRANLKRHLEALFAKDPPSYRPHEIDQGLVAQAREVLNRPLPAERVFSRLQESGLSDRFPDFIVSREAGHYADRVFKSKGSSSLDTKVDALYTYEGYHQGFNEQVLKIIAALEQERWVLGKGISIDDKKSLVEDVRTLYLDEYIRQWRAVLDDVVLVDARSARELSGILGLLSDKRESPMLLLFQAIDRETDLARPVEKEEGVVDKAIDIGQRSFGRVSKLWDEVEPVPTAPTKAPEQRVSDAFSAIHALVQGEDGQASELEGILDRLQPLYIYMDNYADREHQGSQLLEFLQEKSPEADAVAQASERLPAPVGTWLANLAQDSADTVSGGKLAELNKLWRAEVLDFCQRATHDRYPFQPGSKAETPIKDFVQLFGANGDLDRFFKTNLASSVDTSANPWRWVGEGKGISTEALAQFQRAGAIRDSYFSGGANLGLEFKLTAVGMDNQAKKFLLDLDGQTVIFRHEAGRSWTLKWPVPDGPGRVRIMFVDVIDKEHSLTEEGPWAWFRILDRSTLNMKDDELYRVTFQLSGLRATFDLDALSVRNPFGLTDLRNFRCPERL